MFDKYILKLSRILGRKPTTCEMIRYAINGITDFILYGSSISDYFELGFYNKSRIEKKTYLTSRFHVKFVNAFDEMEKLRFHNSKRQEYLELKEFMGREQLFSTECTIDELRDFVKRHPQFLYKPDASDCGKGIKLINSTDYSLSYLFEIIRREPAILDELVIQHEDMNKICPGSVNTLRIVTAKINNKVTIIAAALRLGSGTSLVDNFSAGGFVGAVNLKTGEIIDDGENYTGQRFSEHPFTKVRFKGFMIPNWDKVVELIKNCSKSYNVNYVGWDIAVRQDDVIVIEANIMPMIHAFQIAGNGGKKSIYTHLLKEKKLYSKHLIS